MIYVRFASKESMHSNPRMSQHAAEARCSWEFYSAAAESFCAGCFADTGRAAAARWDAFLRRRYAIRRLRLIRTRCCCPMESLWIKNRRNAMGIETDRAFSPMPHVFAHLSDAKKTRP